MTDSPATVIVAVLDFAFLFLATVKVIRPAPVPLLEVRVSHSTSTEADQAQPPSATTCMLPDDAGNPISCDLGDNTKVQTGVEPF